MTVPDAPAVIRAVILHYGYKILAGAGTVSTTAEAEACLGAGAEFLVSPGLSLPVMRMAQARGKLAIPGVLTPTEVMTAQNEGAKLVKIFPCGCVGGPKYIKALRAPFPHLAMIPTGGVNISNASEYMSAGAFALGVGGDLVDTTAWQEGNTQKIVDAARALVNAVRAVRFS
jgi:2-dehydro-3-deoxyphosphogluconate aldolase/(4S)-4-hydroxy-2-oxoglutarate aldolase